MSRIKHVVFDSSLLVWEGKLKEMIDKKIVSSYSEGGRVIIAAKGVNKSTLKKLLQKEGK